MPASARVTKMWIQQKGLIPFLFLGFALYFFYDGSVGYPRSDERWTKHKELTEKNGGKTEEWDAYAKERGWKTTPPEKYLGPKKYQEQFWVGGIVGVVGTVALIYWLRHKRRVIRNDAEGLYDPATGQLVPYGEITRIDKSKWKSKGFAYVHYKRAGKEGKITLDDAKYDPTSLETILAETESKAASAVIETPAPSTGEAAK